MTLRQVVLSARIQQRKAHMQELMSHREELRKRREAMTTREEELTAAVNEVTEETSQEDRSALDEQVEQWEADDATLRSEEEKADADIQADQTAIDEMQRELDDINERGTAKPAGPEKKPENRRESNNMSTYNTRRLWFGMEHQERDAFIARDDVKTFARGIRELIKEKRTVNGAELSIPIVMLPLIRTVAAEASKLLKHVNVQRVRGESRINVAGIIPEAVWTDACAKINEVDWSFGQVQMDNYKVAAGMYLCNAIVEDSDLDLITEVMTMLGKAIGLALDKAILYGTGVKMPMGIVTRLTQTEEPASYPANAPDWVNLSESNVLAVTGKTGKELFQALVLATGAINADYANGVTVWAMSRKTKIKLVSEALSISAAGAVVTGIENTMPVIGGAIEELNFIPDNVVIGGYGDMYTLVESSSVKMAYSTEARFMEDETAVKATARYDGMPVIGGAFVAIGIDGAKPTAGAVTFAADKANQTV